MNNQELVAHLTERRACKEAMTWLGERDSDQMWNDCPRADWLLWYASAHLTRQELVLLACVCARTALKFVPDGEDRPRLAIETAERWARGEASLEEVRTAARAAYVAYAAARAADAAYAAYAAADAAYAAYAAHAADASYAAARDESHAQMCALIREKFPQYPVKV